MHGDLTRERVSDVVSEIFLGRENLSPFSRFNEMLPVDCKETTTSKERDKKRTKAKDKKK